MSDVSIWLNFNPSVLFYYISNAVLNTTAIENHGLAASLPVHCFQACKLRGCRTRPEYLRLALLLELQTQWPRQIMGKTADA